MDQQTLEDRLRALETARYKTVGELNAHRTILLSAWLTLIRRSTEPPDQILGLLKAGWLREAHLPLKTFPGIDPSELDAMSQEYEAAIARLVADLQRVVSM